MHICTCVYKYYICMCICESTCLNVYTHICIYAYICAYIYKYIYIHTQLSLLCSHWSESEMCIYIHIYIHIYIQRTENFPRTLVLQIWILASSRQLARYDAAADAESVPCGRDNGAADLLNGRNQSVIGSLGLSTGWQPHWNTHYTSSKCARIKRATSHLAAVLLITTQLLLQQRKLTFFWFPLINIVFMVAFWNDWMIFCLYM